MSKRYETKNVVQKVEIGITCDNCHGQFSDGYGFSSSHSEWGNDSMESFEYHDACSFKCYVQIVKERLDHWKEYGSLEIDGKDRTFMEALVADAKNAQIDILDKIEALSITHPSNDEKFADAVLETIEAMRSTFGQPSGSLSDE